jgi:hypothetical protein
MNMADFYYTDCGFYTEETGETDRFTRFLIDNGIKTGVVAQTVNIDPGLELCQRCKWTIGQISPVSTFRVKRIGSIQVFRMSIDIYRLQIALATFHPRPFRVLAGLPGTQRKTNRLIQ